MRIEDRLRNAADELRTELEHVAVPPVPSLHPWRAAVVVGGVLLGLVAGVWLSLSQGGQNPANPTTSAVLTTTPATSGTVPELLGLTLGEAEASAAAAGYAAVAEASDSQDRDSLVIAQEPPSGVGVPRDTAIGLRTASLFEVGCASQDQGPTFSNGTAYGGITLFGLSDGAVITFEPPYPSPTSGWYPVTEVPIRLDSGEDPVWLIVRESPSGGTAGLLFDPAASNDIGRYRIEDTTQAVQLDRCHTDRPTQYFGGLVADRPGCVGLWLYDGSLATDPIVVHLGIQTACNE